MLLNFWATTAPLCRDQLRASPSAPVSSCRKPAENSSYERRRRGSNVQPHDHLRRRRDFPFRFSLQREEVAGIYNIIYRYLFDRRRDLAIPTSFLLDKEGMIVKVYQGPIDPQRVLEDVKSVPTTAADRMQKALPFGGVLYQDAFLRNDFTYGVAMFQHGYLEQAAESFQQVIAAKPERSGRRITTSALSTCEETIFSRRASILSRP